MDTKDCQNEVFPARFSLNVGDKVLIKQPKKDKMSTPFKPEPLDIKDKKGSMITAQTAEHTVTRNASFFKTLPSNIPILPVPSDEEEQSTPLTEAAETFEPVTPAEPVEPVTPAEPVKAVGSSEPPALRRSARTRRMPEYFKDYVT